MQYARNVMCIVMCKCIEKITLEKQCGQTRFRVTTTLPAQRILSISNQAGSAMQLGKHTVNLPQDRGITAAW